jgi:hypothetical protein
MVNRMANFLNLVFLITLPKNDRHDLKMGSIDVSRRQLQSGNYGNFSFARPFFDFDCIFLREIFFRVWLDKIYASDYVHRTLLIIITIFSFLKKLTACAVSLRPAHDVHTNVPII